MARVRWDRRVHARYGGEGFLVPRPRGAGVQGGAAGGREGQRRSGIRSWRVSFLRRPRAGVSGLSPCGRPIRQGRSVLEGTDENLSRPSQGFDEAASRMVRAWQADVMELVAGEGMNKRSRARFMAFGVNGVSVALMLVVFAHTGGLSGAEAGIAGGSAVSLPSVYWRHSLVTMRCDVWRRSAKDQLDARVEGLLANEVTRYQAVLDTFGSRC